MGWESLNKYVCSARTHTHPHAFIVRVALSPSTITGIVCRKLWLWKLPTIFRYRFLTIFQMGFFSFSDVHCSHHRRRWHHLTRAEAHRRRRHLRWRTENQWKRVKQKSIFSSHIGCTQCECSVCDLLHSFRTSSYSMNETRHKTVRTPACSSSQLTFVGYYYYFLLFSLVIVRSIALFLFASLRVGLLSPSTPIAFTPCETNKRRERERRPLLVIACTI